MKAIRFDGVTRVLGESQGYIGLPVMDHVMALAIDEGGGGEVPCMTTRWLPTDEERLHIMRGGAIEIRILGDKHPPIVVTAEDPSEVFLGAKPSLVP